MKIEVTISKESGEILEDITVDSEGTGITDPQEFADWLTEQIGNLVDVEHV